MTDQERFAMTLAASVISHWLESAEEDCGEKNCGDCRPWRPARKALEALNNCLEEKQ